MPAPVKLNIKAVNEVMKSPGVEALLRERSEALARAAGDGFEAETDNSHPWIVRSWVRAETTDAMIAEARDKDLTKALGRLAGGEG